MEILRVDGMAAPCRAVIEQAAWLTKKGRGRALRIPKTFRWKQGEKASGVSSFRKGPFMAGERECGRRHPWSASVNIVPRAKGLHR
jgi:hypothetical protein